MNNSLTPYSKRIELFLLCVIFLMGLAGYFFPPKLEDNHCSCLVPDDKIILSPLNKEQRLQYLTTIVLQHQASYSEDQRSRESERTQTRLLFATLVAVIWVASFSIDEPNRTVVVFAILALGFVVYLSDVRTIETGRKEIVEKAFLDNTILQLANLPPQDNRYYRLDYSAVRAYEKNAGDIHFSRIFKLFIRPEPSQILLYLTPMFIILLVRRFMKL
jgi:hypothetical protein